MYVCHNVSISHSRRHSEVTRWLSLAGAPTKFWATVFGPLNWNSAPCDDHAWSVSIPLCHALDWSAFKFVLLLIKKRIPSQNNITFHVNRAEAQTSPDGMFRKKKQERKGDGCIWSQGARWWELLIWDAKTLEIQTGIREGSHRFFGIEKELLTPTTITTTTTNSTKAQVVYEGPSFTMM